MGGAYLNYMSAETFSFNLRSFPCEGAVLTREIKSYKMVDTKTAYKIKHEQFWTNYSDYNDISLFMSLFMYFDRKSIHI